MDKDGDVAAQCPAKAPLRSTKPIRLLLVGSFDLFHFGHVRAFKRAKELFPNAEVVVGVVADKIVMKQKGAPVINQRGRAEVVQACRYVDEVLLDTPWAPDLAYLEEKNIDFIVGDEDSQSLYHDAYETGRFKFVERTEGVSSAMILTRVIGNYSAFLKRSVRSGIDMKAFNVSLLRRARVNASMMIEDKSNVLPDWTSPQYISGYLKQVGERVLSDWNTLGQLRENIVRGVNTTEEEIEEDKDTETLMREAQFLQFCQDLVPGWKAITLADVSFTVISGGLTNQLTKISMKKESSSRIKPSAPQNVLVRVYGVGTESFFDRENEHRIFKQFSDEGIGPKLFGLFEGGRVEQFLDATSLTSTADFPVYLSKIGAKIAEIHHATVDLPKRPSLFSNLYMWFDAAKNAPIDKPEDLELLKKIDFDALENELSDLKEKLGALNSPVCFCHNDLICGNMMKDKQDNIMFIDFEYGSYNFRGYDFGNHFCEWIIDYNVSEYPKFKIDASKYPTKEQQRELFRSYLRRCHVLNQEEGAVSDEEVEALMKEAIRFALAGHFLWSLWAIKQAASSDIDFGYMEYAVQRIAEYYRLKQEIYGE